MAKDNSDYKKPRTNLYDLLPEVLRSDTNHSLLENVHNRFLTKDETVTVYGYAGDINKYASVDRQIRETDPHHQAYQLQPVLHSKIGTVNHTATYKDIVKQLELLGVDPERQDEWGDCDVYVWAPPIDIDKFTNYQDYYWDDARKTVPQYITIENRCNRADDKLRSYLSLLNTFTGYEYDPDTLEPSEENDPNIALLPIVAFATNGIIVAGDFSRLFIAGFQFFITGSSTASLNGKYWTSDSSVYDDQQDITTIYAVEDLGTLPAIADGFVDLAAQLFEFQTTRNCLCDGVTEGFDSTLFDDYSASGSWLDTIPTSPPVSPQKYDTWHDVTNHTLWQYDGTQWVVVDADTSAENAQIRNNVTFDEAAACEQETDPWAVQNKWSHRTARTNGSARQAVMPIIEYKSQLEVNEWVEVVHKWKYRRSRSEPFVGVDQGPTLFELTPVSIFEITGTIVGAYFTLAPIYGDLRESLKVGDVFRVNDVGQFYEFSVRSIEFQKPADSNYYQTVIFVNEVVPPALATPSSDRYLSPAFTSRESQWRGYGEHWLYDGIDDTVPATHTDVSPYLFVPSDAVRQTYTSPDGQERYDYYVGLDRQEFSSISSATRTLTLASAGPDDGGAIWSSWNIYDRLGISQRSVYGYGDVKVYFNGVRQYGNYTEVPTPLNPGLPVDPEDIRYYNPNSVNPYNRVPHVAAIQFTRSLPANTTVTVEVGAHSRVDVGRETVLVRTDPSDSWQPVLVSLLRYKKSEQIKRFANQNPLFDVYNVDGTYNGVSQVFSYKESETGQVDPVLGKRIIKSEDGRDYQFELFLIDSQQRMLAYRDLNDVPPYWVDKEAEKVWIWNQDHWTDVYSQYLNLRYPFYQTANPQALNPSAFVSSDSDGVLWFNPTNDVLARWDSTTQVWTQLAATIQQHDPSLQTVWKPSKHFVPTFVDSERVPVQPGLEGFAVCYNDGDVRYYLQAYDQQQLVWTDDVTLAVRYPTRIRADVAKAAATGIDNSRRYRTVWVESDWELPDQLLYNPLHEYRTEMSYVELFSHFKSIIDNQPQIPGTYSGNNLFAVNQNDVDYSVGGLIKEHSDSFDIMLSAIFSNSSTPISVIDFAHDRYVGALLFMKEYYQMNPQMLLDTSAAALSDLSNYVTERLIQQHELNENNILVFTDTTSYDKSTDTGVENWIATLPNIGLVDKVLPVRLLDPARGIDQIRHHDGHYDSHSYDEGFVSSLMYKLIQTPDTRVTPPRPIGIRGPLANRPATFTTFEQKYGPFRNGVLWSSLIGGRTVVYKFNVSYISLNTPSASSVDGSLWYDLHTDTLRIKSGTSWLPTTGTIGDENIEAGWDIVSFSQIFNDAVYEVENRLYEAAPDYPHLKIDYEAVRAIDPVLYDQYLYEAFVEYTKKVTIEDAYTQVRVYSQTDPFTWNYRYSSIVNYPYDTGASQYSGGCWQDLYQKLYGTPYPHLEPWVLQGFAGKPDWWDAEYKDDTNARRWKPIMWQNVLGGVIPPSYQVQGQVVHNWYYVSVNVGDTPVVCGSNTYAPDDLLPPYFPVATCMGSLYTGPVRSVFSVFAQIVSPSSNYAYGDSGPVEWKWKNSAQYLYDRLKVVFRMEPVRYQDWTFGNQSLIVGGLAVDQRTGRVASVVDTLFHGTLMPGNQVYQVYGTNQWYVNFNRYYGIDTNVDFNVLWTMWRPTLTYAFTSIVDTESIEITNKYFDISKDHDYQIVLARHPFIADSWINGFTVYAENIPPKLNYAHKDDSEWQFRLDLMSKIVVPTFGYGVQLYPVHIDVASSTLTAGMYPIVGYDASVGVLFVKENRVEQIVAGDEVIISGSSTNDGTYVVQSVAYDAVLNRTNVTVGRLDPMTVYGSLATTKTRVKWQTGDEVWVNSTQVLPTVHDLFNNTPADIVLDGALPYFVVREYDINGNILANTFKLARTRNEAYARKTIEFVDAGTGQVTCGKIASTFRALNGKSTALVWRHYELDRDVVISLEFPKKHYGIQTVINLTDGHAAYVANQGYTFDDITDKDTTGRTFDWQYEQEKFIDWAYSLRPQIHSLGNDRFQVVVDNINTEFMKFTTSTPTWVAGQQITFSASGSLPSPLLSNMAYYYVPSEDGKFKVALSRLDASAGVGLTLTTAGSGKVHVAIYEDRQVIARTEINPVRYLITYNPTQGVVSDVVRGPYDDIRTNMTIYDYKGNPVNTNDLYVERYDTKTRVRLQRGVANPYNDPQSALLDDLHTGGAHIITEGYEHIVLFNDYTIVGDLVADPFLGLHVNRFDMLFQRTPARSMRPNIGGYYLHNKSKYIRNIEASVDDLRHVYSAIIPDERATMTRYSRGTLGYTGTLDYLTQININPKSQFLFWRGMIQQKGSVASVNAYTNSRRFEGANIDEYWAYKVGEFGEVQQQMYPAISLAMQDAFDSDLKFEFVNPIDDDTPVTAGFENITLGLDHHDRWYQYPDQKQTVATSLNMYFDAELTNKYRVFFGRDVPPRLHDHVDLWYNTATQTLNRWIDTQWVIVDDVDLFDVMPQPVADGSPGVYFVFDQPCDNVLSYAQRTNLSQDVGDFTSVKLVEQRDYKKVNGHVYLFELWNENDLALRNPIESYSVPATANSTFTLPYDYQLGANTIMVFVNGLSRENYALEQRLQTKTFNIDPIDVIGQAFYIKGDVREYFITNSTFTVATSNVLLADSTFTVSTTAYDGTRTEVVVKEPIDVFVNPAQQLTVDWSSVVVSDAIISVDVGTLDNFLEVNPTTVRLQSQVTTADKVEVVHINTSSNTTMPFYRQVTLARAGQTLVDLSWDYVVGAGSMFVFVDGKKQVVNVDYVEYGSRSIVFLQQLAEGNVIDVIDFRIDDLETFVQIATDSRVFISTPGQTQFSLPWVYDSNFQAMMVFVDGIKRSDYAVAPSAIVFATPLTGGQQVEVVRLYETVVDHGIKNGDVVNVFTVNPNYQQFTPLKLIDVKTDPETVITDIPAWDPARGRHDTNGIHIVDLQTSQDPATYNNAVIGGSDTTCWREHHIGTTWLDTTTLGYMPYYDDQVVPVVDDRLDMWGQLAPWGSVVLYRWISTNLSPTDWLDISVNGESPIVSGMPKATLLRRTRDPQQLTVVVSETGSCEFIFAEACDWQVGTELLFSPAGEADDEQLPTGLLSGVYYKIVQFDPFNPAMFIVCEAHDETQTPIVVAQPDQPSTFYVHAVRPFDNYDWAEERFVRQRFYAPLISRSTTVTSSLVLKLDPALFRPATEYKQGDLVDIYVNGVLVQEEVEVLATMSINLTSVGPFANNEIIDVVRPLHTITEEEAEFDPSVEDDGTMLVQWQQTYNFTLTITDEGTTYYYWVTETTDTADNRMSLVSATDALTQTSSPYVVYQKLMQPTAVSFDKEISSVPFRYRQSVVRGISSYLVDDDRFVLRYLKDLSLRDRLDDVTSALALKPIHAEWEMFREQQPYHIPRTLWNKITEAIVAYKLDDPSQRVPTLEREAYDLEHGTDTRFGLGSEQAFVDGQLALATIVADLENPANDFSPVNIHEFSQLYQLDGATPEQIVETMNAIYLTFSNVHVNRMFFAVLADALSTKAKYPDLMKTSMVALHGIRVLEVNGMNDD